MWQSEEFLLADLAHAVYIQLYVAFLYLMQVPKSSLSVVTIMFCFFVWLPLYLRKILQPFSIFKYFEMSKLHKTHFALQY